MCTLTMTLPIGSRRVAHPFASGNVGAAAGSCQLAASPLLGVHAGNVDCRSGAIELAISQREFFGDAQELGD